MLKAKHNGFLLRFRTGYVIFRVPVQNDNVGASRVGREGHPLALPQDIVGTDWPLCIHVGTPNRYNFDLGLEGHNISRGYYLREK